MSFDVLQDKIREMKNPTVAGLDARIEYVPEYIRKAVFEQYGVLHYCKPNVSNFVARTTSMALSNIFVPLFFKIGDVGGVLSMIQCSAGFRKGVYMYGGKPVNDYVASHFNLPSNNIDIYLAAF